MALIEATHLGKQSPYPQRYDKSVLVAVPRILNREQYGLSNEKLPFTGVDVWHAYEFGFLTQSGMPVVGILKIVYPATSEFLVESKSLKLYLNAFNMERFGKTREEGVVRAMDYIQTDLGALLKCPVNVNYFNYSSKLTANDFTDYLILEEQPGYDQILCESFTENTDLLDVSNQDGEIKWGTHLLRSNCKITHQPDWGALFIHMKSKYLPTPDSVIKYIVSVRNENHFHEEICEMVFKRMADRYSPSLLTVTCLYTRRGGIDICPVRTTNASDIPASLSNPQHLSQTIFRQ
jgi:7-cyano-7-deazaguanine reductase